MVTKGLEGEGTRGALLLAASELLEESGMGAVTLRAVGERAGVSRQAPYKHFEGKEGLLSVVAVGFFERLGEEMEAACSGVAGSWRRLGAVAEAYVRFALASPPRYRLMFGSGVKNSSSAEVHAAAGAVYGLFVGIVEENVEAGLLVGEPVEISALVYAAAHGAVDLTLSGHAEESKGLGDPSDLVRLLLDRLRR